MKNFLSIDLETTGLDEHRCQTLEFGAVIGDFEDTDPFGLPSFKRRFKYPVLQGDPYALALNHKLIAEMAQGIGEWHDINGGWVEEFNAWLRSFGWTLMWAHKPPLLKITVTGKNIGSFDRRFLAMVPEWDWNAYSHRYLDVGSLYFRPAEDDVLPDLKKCANRAGINILDYNLHDAVDDARLVVEIIRRYYKQCSSTSN